MPTFVFVENRSRKHMQLQHFPDRGKTLEANLLFKDKKLEKKGNF